MIASIEIVRDFNKKYYANAYLDDDFVRGIPEYVPFPVLKQAVRRYVGIQLPRATDLKWSRIGRKQYAYFTKEVA